MPSEGHRRHTRKICQYLHRFGEAHWDSWGATGTGKIFGKRRDVSRLGARGTGKIFGERRYVSGVLEGLGLILVSGETCRGRVLGLGRF